MTRWSGRRADGYGVGRIDRTNEQKTDKSSDDLLMGGTKIMTGIKLMDWCGPAAGRYLSCYKIGHLCLCFDGLCEPVCVATVTYMCNSTQKWLLSSCYLIDAVQGQKFGLRRK